MTIHARFLPKYPKRISVTNGLTKTEANGVVTLGFDYANSEFGAELQQAIDAADADATATAADRVAVAADLAAANAAAAIATGAVSLFGTKTLASAAHPTAAYSFVLTQGLAAAGDGGGALYKNNGTTTGDLIVTLADGTTHAGYDVQRVPHFSPQQFAVIGNVDDRTAFQAALDKLQDGDTFVFPGWATAKIVNGVGTGATLVDQRADAVANGGLLALTCDKNDIRIVIDGTVSAASCLDDLFRFTGNRVQLTGRGLIQNITGQWLDTNSAGDPNPDLVQWYPSLVYFQGDDSGVDGGGALRFLNPCQTGARLGGNRNYVFKTRFIGGPPSYRPNGGTGTAMFNIYSGLPATVRQDNKVIGNWFDPNPTGGQMYQNIFGTNVRATYADNHHECGWELGVYNYGADCKIHSEQMNNVTAAIQNMASGGSIRDCRITALNGGILCMSTSYLQIEGNVLRTNNIGISLRRDVANGVPQTNTDRDIIIANNMVELFGAVAAQASPIDVSLDNSVVGLKIAGNQVIGGGGGAYSQAGIRVIGYASSLAIDVEIAGNTSRYANGNAIYAQYCSQPRISNNRILNSNNNAADGASAIGLTYVTGALLEDNIAEDTRGTPLTQRVIDALGANSNSGIRARRNVGIGLDASQTALVSVPSDTSSEAVGNSRNNAPTDGIFTVSNVISDSVTAPGVVAGATIIITPANNDAEVIQGGAQRVKITSVANGSFTWTTASGVATASATAKFAWRAIQ